MPQILWSAVLFLTLHSMATAVIPRKCDPAMLAGQQVAREIELVRTEALVELMTTTDGKVSGALLAASRYKKTKQIPDFLVEAFPALRPLQILDVSWEDLQPDLQKRLLWYVSEDHDFEASRAIPGFKMKDRIRIRPKNDFEFLGQSYKANQEYEIDLTGFLLPRVEYGSGGKISPSRLLELHFRGTKPSVLRREIATFASEVTDALLRSPSKLKLSGDHQHIPDKIPTEFFNTLRAEGFEANVGAAILTLYHQMAELAMLIEGENQGIAPGRVPDKNPSDPPIFDYLDQASVKKAFLYFQALERGENPPLGTSLKEKNVGIRGHDTYTDNSLWGFELRHPDWKASEGLGYQEIADGIKHTLKHQDFPISKADALKFVQENEGHLPDALAKLWFRKSAKELKQDHEGSELRPLVQRVIGHWQQEDFEPRPGFNDHHNAFLPVLLMRWSEHPVVKYNPKLSKSVLLAQKKYLEKALALDATHSSARELVLGFLTESGITSEIDRIVKRK